VLALAFATHAFAHGSPDQVNDVVPTGGVSCAMRSAHMGQWVTPARPNLVAVELVLITHVGWAVPAEGVVLRLDIREGSPEAPVLATTTTRITHERGQRTSLRPHFDLTTPLRTDVGNTLFLDLTVPMKVDGLGQWFPMFSWRGRDDDPYPRGQSLPCFESPTRMLLPPPDRRFDFNFITFWEGDRSDRVCPQIRDKVPAPALLWALANPDRIAGYNLLERPGSPAGPYNRLRKWLSLRRLTIPFHPIWNGLVYRAGCP